MWMAVGANVVGAERQPSHIARAEEGRNQLGQTYKLLEEMYNK